MSGEKTKNGRDIKSMIDELSEKEKAAPLSSYDKGLVTGLRIAYLLQNPRMPAAERYKLRLYQREDDIAAAPEMYVVLEGTLKCLELLGVDITIDERDLREIVSNVLKKARGEK